MPIPMREPIPQLLDELRLRGVARVLDTELDRAEREGSPAAEVLLRLLREEAAARREAAVANRMKRAKIPWHWTLDTFPYDRQPGIDRAQIRALAGLDFLKRNDNLLLIGPTGTGKTGIALGLLRAACLNGYAGRFYNAQQLFEELYASLADRTSTKLITRLARITPLVVDELSYLNLKPEQVNAFFRLIDQRYARVSTIITSNLDPSDWYGLFNRKDLVDALLDRLQHHCVIIHIRGPSLRVPDPPPSPPLAAPSKPKPAAAKTAARTR